MRREVTLALSIAGFSGMLAAVGAYDWMSSMSDANNRPAVASGPSMKLTTVVVAKDNLNFGTVLTKDKLGTTEWPSENVPKGAFRSVEEMFAEQETRTVLETIQTKEPVLKGKVTGPGQRASLATMLRNGMKAVSIRVDDVIGVGGFVLPGDFVDVLVTFGKRSSEETRDQTFQPYTELLLQRIRVLAIDQSADPRQDGAKLVRTVTLEATQVDAQKITLAGTIASISLALREQSASAVQIAQRRVTADDLGEDSGDKRVAVALEPTIAVAPPAPSAPVDAVWSPPRAKVKIVRTGVPTEYTVDRLIVDR
ncbi:MAG: Flp pilus assembly protein CpaB [Hyphomicrobium sp.]